MAGNIHFDLSDQIEEKITQSYTDLCSDLTEKLTALDSKLAEICKRTGYEPMVNVVNKTKKLFGEEISKTADSAFQAWLIGDGSFSKAAQNSQAGEDALGTAKNLESSIVEKFDTFWSSNPFVNEIAVDTSRPKIESNDFDELRDLYQKFSKEIDDLNNKAVNDILKDGEDNPTYNVIIPAIRAIAEPIKKAFESFCKKIDEAKGQSEAFMKAQSDKNTEAATAAITTSASAKDIAASLNMFEGV